MTDYASNADDILKKPGRRNWLRNAAMAASGVLVLLLVVTGCTKEQWDHLKHGSGGDVGSGASGWYNLRVHYPDFDGVKLVEGYLGPVGNDYTTSNIWWDYMKIIDSKSPHDERSKFKLHEGPNGFDYWEIDDGYWLSLRYSGWAYRSYIGNRVGWKIVDGKLYSDYARWKDFPLGKPYPWFGSRYFVGVHLDVELYNCELVPAE